MLKILVDVLVTQIVHRYCFIIFTVVQLEINPFFQQKDLVQKLTSNGIAIQAYSPLANAQKLNDERLIKIAKIYDATTAQLLIQWCIQKGYSCVTKSTNKMHLDENINLGEFFIEDIDMKVRSLYVLQVPVYKKHQN